MESFADIEGPVRIGLGFLLLWVAVVGALAGVAAVLLRKFLARSRDGGSRTQVAEISPLDRALQRLGILREAYRDQEAEAFSVEVSDIVRDFLEDVLEIPAREQTSEEFLHALSGKQDLPRVLHESMPAFLEACDRVKFARQELSSTEREPLLQTAEGVVRETNQALHPEPVTVSPVPR